MNRLAIGIYFLVVLSQFCPAQQYKVLYNFGSDLTKGILPAYNPVADKVGNLYGVTTAGGAPGTCFSGCGVVFQLSHKGNVWTETVLYTFCQGGSKFDCPDGGQPNGLLIDSGGNLYGTTNSGGINNGGEGVVFELSPPAQRGQPWTYTVLYNFCSDFNDHVCDDGSGPYAGLTMDSAGNLYGTTISGGANDAGAGGVVFKLTHGAGGWTESVLYNFCALQYCADTFRPEQTVTFDSKGNLYGTTTTSGYGSDQCTTTCGAIYELSPGANGWTEELLYSFSALPKDPGQVLWPGPVTFDALGNLYTTFTYGGNYDGYYDGNGGVVRLTTNGKLQQFLFDYTDGSNPSFGVLLDSRRRTLFGTTTGGGDNNYPGNVFEIDPSGKETVLYTFCHVANCVDGLNPSGLFEAPSGNLFGFTASGGTQFNGAGVAFEIVRN